MRIAVLSDIHGNLEALQVAFDEAERLGAEAYVCLGDVVGYGPDPEACLDLVRERCEACVLGNHDAAVAHEDGVEYLPRDGQAAALKHREWLSEDQVAWLRALPLTAVSHGATLAHASPDRPSDWNRLDTYSAVQAQFGAFGTAVCFIGHSHRPAVVSDKIGVSKVRPGPRYLINVGSVGQPRDHDPRLAFGLFDAEAVSYELVRAHYDTARTAQKIIERGLPAALGERLRRGL